LQVTQDRAGGQRTLAHRGSNAGVGIGDDVARSEDAGRGRAQVAVDDDRARPVEVELAGHRSRARPASDERTSCSSARTIIVISSRNDTVGFQPTSLFAVVDAEGTPATGH